ncbi:MAG: PfkB family carbohydrate kinase [Planctomycetota bacterium]|nr:PfkB family carbohydrate kinase [Planctomycetota bacterium]
MSDVRIVTVTLNPAVDRVIEAPSFKVGAHVTGHIVAWYPTGRGITISRAFANVGVRSIATGFVGRAELNMFEEYLQRVAHGRAVSQFLVVRARTRDNITIVDPVEDTDTHIRDAGFKVQPDDVTRISSKLSMLAREGTIMCFGGSLPPGVTPADFANMVSRCRIQRARVVLDVADNALEAVRDQRIWMVKLNRAQVARLAGRELANEGDFLQAARSLSAADSGPFEYVLATRGAEGAVLFGPNVALLGRVGVHPGRVVSTVGCGESLVAGVIADYLRTGDWSAALHEGMALATANATGREAGAADPEDLAEFREAAMIEPVT